MNATLESVLNVIEGGTFTGFDYFLFILMLSVSMGIGIYFGFFDGKEKTTEEYLMGGRRMKTIPIAISLVASQLSAVSIVTFPSEIYSFGSHYLIMIVPMMFIYTYIMNKSILPVFYNNKIVNCFAYLELRFDKRTRTMVTMTFLVMALLMLPVGGFVPAIAFSSVTGYNIHIINAVVTAICVAYTMLGGIKAVVWTDVLQAVVMIGSVGIVFVIALGKVGGISEVFSRSLDGGRLTNLDWSIDFRTRSTFWNMALGGLFQWTAHLMFNQTCIQRLCSLPSVKHAQRSLYIFAIGCSTIFLCNGLLGLVMYTYYYDCDPYKVGTVRMADKLVPYFVNDIVSWIPGMTGVFISCVFSASLSTTSAYLNTLGGICYNDYIRKIPGFVHTEHRAQFLMKLTVLLVGIYCVLCGFVVELAGSLFQVIVTIVSVSMGCVSGVFTLGMFFPRSNREGSFWGGLVAMATMTTIVVGNMILHFRGKFKYIPLPTNVDGCTAAQNISMIAKTLANSTLSMEMPAVGSGDDSFSMFKISFMWFAFIGAITVWLVGLPVSYFFGPKDVRNTLDPNLISPWAQCLLPKGMKHVPMQEKERKDVECNNCTAVDDAEVEKLTGKTTITFSPET